MIHIKVQYDAYNRTFKLLDRGFGTFLEDYGVYNLAIPVAVEEADEQDVLIAVETTMAHA